MKKLNTLIDCDVDMDIYGITDDSRKVQEGYLFVATKGYHVDHFDYIMDAIKRGCSFIICDKWIDIHFPHFIVENINDCYIELCKKFYDIHFSNFHFIGITGTDGKTTTTTIIKRLLGECAYLGTNGLEVGEDFYTTDNTTPCVSDLYRYLRVIEDHNCSTVSMEVSSEALLHDRLKSFSYDIVGFTNIYEDHLNVHKTLENYIESKKKLLYLVKKDGWVVLNGDDEKLKGISSSNVVRFGFGEDNDFVIHSFEKKGKYTSIVLKNQENCWRFLSPYQGKYNVYNVVMAFVVCYLYGMESERLISKIKELEPVMGRGELLNFGQKFDIVLDYAHTVNGIRSVLESYENYKRKIVVTGSAGGREREKRPVIGKLVLEKSDIAIFTMDDPRFEDPDEIINQMVGNSEKEYFRIIDREDAISYALSIAEEGDVVLILGKGRDNYMAIEDKKIHYNDYDVISHYFQQK